MSGNDRVRLLDMSGLEVTEAMAFERVLGEGIRDVMSELFFTNAGVLMGYIQAGQTSVIEDIVASSTERTLRPGMLRYGRNGHAHADWGRAPTASIDMEFHHASLSVFFKIVFDEQSVGVEIDSILFHDGVCAPQEGLARLARAVAEARVALC